MRIKSILIVVFLLLSALSYSEAKPEKTGTLNYKGKDGKWHYVTTYKDNKTGATWSSEYVNGDGPHIHTPAQLPSNPYSLINNVGTSGGGVLNDINIENPIQLNCEFKALESGSLEIKVDENIELEIFRLNDGSVILNKSLVYGLPNFQQIFISSNIDASMPYGLVAYKNSVPIYMELFFFDNSLHKSMEEFSSPGYEAEVPPYGSEY